MNLNATILNRKYKWTSIFQVKISQNLNENVQNKNILSNYAVLLFFFQIVINTGTNKRNQIALKFCTSFTIYESKQCVHSARTTR